MTVTDVQESKKWYQNFFNTKPIEELDDFVSFEICGTRFDIITADIKSPTSTGGSVGYWQVNDLEALMERVKALGGIVYRGPLKVPEIQKIILQIQDPFGNIIGFEAPLKE